MSGVYIPGLGMPDNCYNNCPFFTQIQPGIDHGLINYCCLENWKKPITPLAFSVDEAKQGRQPFCPLIHVPDHGDLVDRSILDVLSWTHDPEKDFDDGVLFVLDKLDELPAIISAEGEDYT